MAGRRADELCDYVHIKSAKVSTKEESSSEHVTSGKIFNHWTNLWVVIHIEKSPSFSFVGHCKKESDWLANNKIEKIYLGESFEVEKMGVGYSKKFEHVLQLAFKAYRIDFAFDSKTKMDQWYKALESITNCYHVDLVRCPEHSHLEGEYIMEVTSSCIIAWTFYPDREGQLKWEWHLKHLRRVHWHKNVHKLEVEPGRSSQTGEGRFFFTGLHTSRLFAVMRHLMTHRSTTPTSSNSAPSLSTSASSSPLLSPGTPRRRSDPALLTHSVTANPMYLRVERNNTESEEDWTGGTGDSWTGTSDSGFFVGSNVPQPQDGRNHFILPSGPPPPPPSRPPPKGHYADINISTMDPDNQYVQITRQGHVYDVPNCEASPTTDLHATYQVPRRHHVPPSKSQDGISRLSITDDYCQMSSVSLSRDIKRNGSLPMSRPPRVPAHQKGVNPPTAWANSPTDFQSSH